MKKSELKQLIKEVISEIKLNESSNEKWEKYSIQEFLDTIGQDEYIFTSPTNGASHGDWGKVNFRVNDIENNKVLTLIFETEREAEIAMDVFSKEISNPYEFGSRFDMNPKIIRVTFSE